MLEISFFLKLAPGSEWQVQAVPKALMELCSVDQEKGKNKSTHFTLFASFFFFYCSLSFEVKREREREREGDF